MVTKKHICLWECGNDGELRQTVNLFPYGLGGSNPSTPTNLGLLWRLTGDYGIGRHVERDLFKRRKSINGETVILMAA